MPDEMSTYLKGLKFDERLRSSAAAGFLSNIRLILLFVISIVALGIFALLNLPKRINPQIEIPIIFVSTIVPGSGPKDVENQATIPLENAIKEVEGISNMSSNSTDNMSMIVIEFQSSVSVDDAKNDVQSAVDAVSGLPNEAMKPVVAALDFEDMPVVTFAIIPTGSIQDVSMMQFSKELRTSLEDLPLIKNVVASGLESTEVEIYIRPESYEQYALNPMAIQSAIRNTLKQYPAGAVSSNGSSLSFSIDGEGDDALQTMRSILVPAGSKMVPLGEIAEITQRSSSNQPKSFYATPNEVPKRAVTFSVFKTTSADLEKSAKQAKDEVKTLLERYNNRFTMVVITDYEDQINTQFQDLLRDFLTSIALVFLTLFLFLGIRQAGIASFVIPLSFFSTFAAMYFMDIQMSFLSLFSLLLGLGMIVDDTIVMISATTDYYKTKKFTPLETGLLVWNDYLVPTLSSNLTNVWSFLPLLIASGIIGEFTKVIAVVVTIALVGSTAIALAITIPFMIVILKPRIPKRAVILSTILGVGAVTAILFRITMGSALMPVILLFYVAFLFVAFLTKTNVFRTILAKMHLITVRKKQGANKSLIHALQYGFVSTKRPIAWYKSFLLRVLQSRSAEKKVVFAVVLLSIFSYMLVPLGLVQNEFFPKSDVENVYMSLELPSGTRIEKTEQEAQAILEKLRAISGVSYILADIGTPLDLNSTTAMQTDTNTVRFSLRLVKRAERNVTSMDVSEQIRKMFTGYSQGEIQVIEETSGPPSGSDVEITILGDDFSQLHQYADRTTAYLRSLPGTLNVQISVKSGASKLAFVPNREKMNEHGVSIDQLGYYSRLFASGMAVDSIELDKKDCPKECPVVLRMYRGIVPASMLSSLKIPTQNGSVPLDALGAFELQENPTKITRLDTKRSLTVSASVAPGYNRIQIGTQLQTYVDKELGMASGYTWKVGGVNEENEKSVKSILQSMVIAAILIAVTMVVELRSFRKAFIVMLVIPLAISGVFILFAVTGTPLSFPSLIGILALFGIVVKNSIMIVDKMNKNMEVGIPVKEAIADGASSRLEPIIFSSVTNIIGLIPITLSDPIWRGLGGAMISGLTLSGTIMLLFIPVVYDLWYGKIDTSTHHTK